MGCSFIVCFYLCLIIGMILNKVSTSFGIGLQNGKGRVDINILNKLIF